MQITFYLHDNQVLPRVTGDMPHNVKVSLSRKGKGCCFYLDYFGAHDSHAPSFSSDQETQDYINRVTKDILKAWKTAKKEAKDGL